MQSRLQNWTRFIFTGAALFTCPAIAQEVKPGRLPNLNAPVESVGLVDAANRPIAIHFIQANREGGGYVKPKERQRDCALAQVAAIESELKNPNSPLAIAFPRDSLSNKYRGESGISVMVTRNGALKKADAGDHPKAVVQSLYTSSESAVGTGLQIQLVSEGSEKPCVILTGARLREVIAGDFQQVLRKKNAMHHLVEADGVAEERRRILTALERALDGSQSPELYSSDRIKSLAPAEGPAPSIRDERRPSAADSGR